MKMYDSNDLDLVSYPQQDRNSKKKKKSFEIFQDHSKTMKNNEFSPKIHAVLIKKIFT